jgi:hypothetical protein
MHFFLALAAWILIAAALVFAVVMATHGKILLLAIVLVLFVLAFSKWGCATHD